MELTNDKDPRCKYVVNIKTRDGWTEKTCNHLLAPGMLTRPWIIRCLKCGNTTKKDLH